jgi:hypothetical protein
MKLPRRKFLHLAAGAAALPVVSRIARAQAYPNSDLIKSALAHFADSSRTSPEEKCHQRKWPLFDQELATRL